MIIRGTSTTFQDKSTRIKFTITKKPDVTVAAAETVVPSPSSPSSPSSSSITPTATASASALTSVTPPATVANGLTTKEKAQLVEFKNKMVDIIEKALSGKITLTPTVGLDKSIVDTKKEDRLYKTCYTVKDSNPPLRLRIVPTFGDGTCGYYAIQDKTGYETNMTNKISRETILKKLKTRLQSEDYASIKRIKTYNNFGDRFLSDINNIINGEYADIGVEEDSPTEISCSLDLCSEVLDTPVEVYKLERDTNPTSDLVLMRKYIPTNQTNAIRRIHHTELGCHFSILQECDSENHKEYFEQIPPARKGGKRKTHKKQKKPRSRKIRNRRPKKNITSKSI